MEETRLASSESPADGPTKVPYEPPDYRVIFEKSPVLLSVLDANLTVIASSDDYLEATMRKSEELFGLNVYDAFPDDPNDPTSRATTNLRESIERAISSREPDWMAVVRYPIAKPVEQGGGFEVRYWSPVNAPIYDDDGELLYIVQVVHDVTDYVVRDDPESEVEFALPTRADGVAIGVDVMAKSRDLLESNRELQAAGEAKNEFLSRMSHELRTPLTAISGFAELLTVSDLSEEHEEWAQTILKASRHLAGLVNEILDISKIEAGELALSIEPVALGPVLDDAMELMQPMADRRQIGLTLEGNIRHVYVEADTQRLKQVLINLISNAIKFNRDGGDVWVRVDGDAERVSVAISDTGPGLSEDEVGRLFVPFERLAADSKGIEGTGLGLALSKTLIGAMDGEISVESAIGRGSTFMIDLLRIEPAAIAETKIEDTVLDTREYARDCTLLYIEDTVANAKLVEQILSRRPSVRVLPAMIGRLGIDLAHEHKPDMILLDLHLPDMNGSEVLKKLRDMPETRDIPILILSADATKRQYEEVMQAGARDYLTKPIRVDELLRVVDRYLGDRLTE